MPVNAAVTRSRSAISVATLPRVSSACRSAARAAAWVTADRWYGNRTSSIASITAGVATRYPSRPPANANALLMVRVTISLVGYSATSATALGCAENSP